MSYKKISNSDIVHHQSSLGDIFEEKEERKADKSAPVKIHVPLTMPQRSSKTHFQHLEQSHTVSTPPTNTTSPGSATNTNTTPQVMQSWSPANPPTTATFSEDADVDTERHLPFNSIFSAIKMKHPNQPHTDGPKYTKAPSFETVTTFTSSAKDLYDHPVEDPPNDDDDGDDDIDDAVSSSSSDSSDDETPGPPPKLSLFNNSNRPPLVMHHTNKRSSDSSRGLSINIERTETLTQPRLSGTKTSTMSTLDRLKIPNATSISRSVSTFDELGKKLNHLPTFQRALTTSITSSQSVQLSFEKSLKLRDNQPSFHSMHSFRELCTPPATSMHSVQSQDGLYNHILYGKSPNTPPVTHQPSLEMPSHGRVSFTPSLPSISAKDVLDIAALKRLSSHPSNTVRNNVNPLDLVQKRVLFVSLVQLHRSYLNGIPAFVLEHAVFVFGIKKVWLFPSTIEEKEESKQSYIEHFRSSWSAEFLQMIGNKDSKGHVLWIGPCHVSKAHLVWDMISHKLCQIVDLSVSEEDAKRRKREIELMHKQNAKNRQSQAEEQSCQTDNELVSRFPSDRTDSIPLDVPSMAYSNGPPVVSMFSKNTNNTSLQTITDEEEKTQMSIAETLLKIHHSKQDATQVETDTFHTVYTNMTDDDELDDGMHTDSDYEEKEKEDTGDITPPSGAQPEMQARSTKRVMFNDKLKISVQDVSSNCKYLPYYDGLKVEEGWWRTQYEPVRKEQSDQQKLALAESAKLLSTKQLSAHHNESVKLSAATPIKSMFNIEADEVLKQLRCISTPGDIKLKPIKELFYQSNPTLIPMEYFEWSKYMEYHMHPMHKYWDILQYCERVYAPSMDLTPSASDRSQHNARHGQMVMLQDDEDDEDCVAGFQMIDNLSSNSMNLDAIKEEVNVDNCGMVYMFDYDDASADEYFDDETLLICKPSVPLQTSIQSVKSDSALPCNGRLRGGGSESSVQLFD